MKKAITLLLAASLLLSIAGCGNQDGGKTSGSGTDGSSKTSSAGKANGEVVEVPLLMTNAGNDSQSKLKEWIVEEYNKKYEGQYKAVVEWLPGVAEDIRSKLKMLNASNDLPAIVGELGAEPAFADLLFKNNRLVDLKPEFDASPDWKKMCIPESIEYNTVDGKMYSAPSTSTDYTGVYYNKEHFQKAGIDKFPETWDEFWAACDKLKDAGYTPLSLHTTETGWCPMLLATSSLSESESGQAFLAQMYPTDYNTPEMAQVLEVLKKAFTYSTPDAVGGNYALAANNFCSEKTSMIPNGPWMITSLSDPQFAPEGFEQKVGYAMFPGGTMMSNQGEGYTEGVSVDHPENVQKGAIEYLKFKATEEVIRKNAIETGSFSQVVTLSDEDMKNFTPTMKEYAELVPTIKLTVPSYQSKWDPITQNEVIPTELVNYINGSITAEQLMEKMSAAGEKYKTDGQGQ